MGGPGVGKSSIIKAYTKNNGNDSPTLTAAYFQKKIEVNGEEFSLGIWDTAGSEQYRSIAPIYFRNTVVAFVVTDATNINSDDDANFWLAELSSKCENVLIIIVMNKIDIQPFSQELSQRVNRLASKWNSPSFFTSAKTGQGIDDLFQYAIKNGSLKLSTKKLDEEIKPKQNMSPKSKKLSNPCC